MKKGKKDAKKASTKKVGEKDLAKVSGGAGIFKDSNRGNKVIG